MQKRGKFMKQKMLWMMLVMLSLVVAGCGASDADAVLEDTETMMLDEDYGEVTLCDYKNLSEEKRVYLVSDKDIDSEIEYLVSEYIEYEKQDRPSQEGDYVTVAMTAVSGDETIFDSSDDSFDIQLGYEMLGPEFDEKLTGVSTGDELSFSITYAEDYPDESFAGKEVDYEVKILEITKEFVPELTEEFIVDTLGYASEEDMREQIAASLKSQSDSDSEYELRENLIQQVIDESAVESFSQELYDACAASVDESYLSYAEMFGCESAQEVYELFEMTEEDVEAEVLNQLYRLIVVNEICKRENLALSDDEYKVGLERYAEEYGYESTEELEEEYDKESLYSWILEDKVLDFLEENATIKEVEIGSDEADQETGTEEQVDAIGIREIPLDTEE